MVADKVQPLILQGLSRAAAEPGAKPLVGTKAQPGLFPSTAVGKQAAQRTITEGWIRQDHGMAHITESGLKYLLQQTDAKPVLEDMVRVLEQREAQVQTLTATAKALGDSISGLKATVAAVVPRAVTRSSLEDTVAGAILARLEDWSATAPAGQDCPLPELYRSLSVVDDHLTVGRFHDNLRSLHAKRRLYLHPWTGPLYTLPEPGLALLVGHEVSYYASKRAA